MDPQSHCAVGLAVPEEQIEQGIYDVLIGVNRDESAKLREVLWEIAEGFELAPASIDLAAFEQQMAGIARREDCLKNALHEVQDIYDFVVIDCAPSMGLLTFNALKAATDVIIPVDTGYFALHGLSRQLDTISVLCKQCTRNIEVRVLASMYDIRTKMGREILAELRSHFGQKMFRTVVNFNTKLKEAASLGQPINEYDSASKGYKDFQNLVKEVIGEQKEHRREMVESLNLQLSEISSSAEELLATMPQTAQPAVPPPERKPADIDRKIARVYGTHQLSDAVMFVTLYPRAKSVQIAGDFNNWKPEDTPMSKISDNGVWQVKLPLHRGKYRYRLVVDGKWQQDPYNEKIEMNPYGEYNSIIEVM
jgi:chromosome partitioning protein